MTAPPPASMMASRAGSAAAISKKQRPAACTSPATPDILRRHPPPPARSTVITYLPDAHSAAHSPRPGWGLVLKPVLVMRWGVKSRRDDRFGPCVKRVPVALRRRPAPSRPGQGLARAWPGPGQGLVRAWSGQHRPAGRLATAGSGCRRRRAARWPGSDGGARPACVRPRDGAARRIRRGRRPGYTRAPSGS